MAVGRLVALALSGLLVLATQPAAADGLYRRCTKASDDSAGAWHDCGEAWIKRERGRLDAAWKAVTDGLEGKTRIDLDDEQRAWSAFLETSCRFQANGDWGREGQVMEFPACRAKIIAQRTTTLRSYAAFIKRQP